MPSRRVLWISAVLAIICGGLVWLVVFDLWLGQVERQYLWEQSQSELGLTRRVSLKSMMSQASREGAWIASAWALLVAAAIVAAGAFGFREGRRQGGRGLRESLASHASHSKGED
jgi:hypothetical protein